MIKCLQAIGHCTAAVKVHGRILEDVDQFLKDKEVVLAACKNKEYDFEADKKLQNDKEVVHAALNNIEVYFSD